MRSRPRCLVRSCVDCTLRYHYHQATLLLCVRVSNGTAGCGRSQIKSGQVDRAAANPNMTPACPEGMMACAAQSSCTAAAAVSFKSVEGPGG